MRTVVLKPGETLHVEAPHGIINIRAGLSDRLGRPVTSIETIPDVYAGEPKILLSGRSNTRLIQCKKAKS